MTPTVCTGSVIVAYDSSEHATRAVEWGLAQAALENRPVDVVHTLDLARLPSEAWLGISGDAMPLVERLRAECTATMKAVVATAHLAHPDVEVRLHVLEGDPRQVLVGLSGSAHLLVLGSHGRGPVLSALLGSVSAGVTRASSCPVVVVRPPRGGAPRPGGSGVVVGVDGSVESGPVIEFAFSQASAHALPLTVVHVIRDVVAASVGDRPYPVLEEREEAHLLIAESVAGMAEKFPDVPVTRRLELGLLDQVLEREAQSWDLAVVGRRRHDAWHRLVVGSTTLAVLEHAHGPVAVVPEAPTPGS